MDVDLTRAYADYLRHPEAEDARTGLVDALGRSEALTERDLLAHFAQHGESDLIITEPASPFLGRRAWVGPSLPARAAAGDIWYDTVEAMPMVLVPREPHPGPAARERYPALLAWLACRPVAAWQFAGCRALDGDIPQAAVTTGDSSQAAVGVTRAEAAAYAQRFGKMLSEHLTWQAVPYLLPPSVIEMMWEGIAREWSRLRSDVEDDLALVVPRDAFETDPDDVLESRRDDASPDEDQGSAPVFALPPDTRASDLGLRTTVLIQTGFVAPRPW